MATISYEEALQMLREQLKGLEEAKVQFSMNTDLQWKR
jgi:predicted RNase H-like HicB family nuclease